MKFFFTLVFLENGLYNVTVQRAIGHLLSDSNEMFFYYIDMKGYFYVKIFTYLIIYFPFLTS